LHASGDLALDRPRVMGVVNLTPDSFHDGGKLVIDEIDAPNVAVALRRCEHIAAAGADILDIGGESTRPGAETIGVERECARVLPVLERLRTHPTLAAVPVSIDTRHADVAERAVAAGAVIVNDVSGLADPRMADVVAAAHAGLVIGHLRGEPATMQRDIRFADLLGEVADELAAAVERAVAAGTSRAHILVDPGLGFGKTAEQSAALVASAGWLRAATGCAVLIGASRKSFLGTLLGTRLADRGAERGADRGADRKADRTADRLVGSLAAALIAAERGAAVLRVHDVRETVEALAVARAVRVAFDREAHGRNPD
jgi:dihydropteroate synthase